MQTKTLSLLIIGVLFLCSCKDKSDKSSADKDPILLEALGIQDDAIHIGMSLDSILDARMAEGANAQNIETLKKWKSEVNLWKNNMVVVPGIEHIHDHHDHAGHDHDHNHDHDTHENAASHLSPPEIKSVQIEWKAAIEALRDSIK